LIELA